MRYVFAMLWLVLGFSEFALAQPLGGAPVVFSYADPSGGQQELRGVLYEPTGHATGSVVLSHGSGGWSDYREGYYGRALSSAGYAVLAVDSFGPRGITSIVEDQSKISATRMAFDAFAARRYLISRGYPADRTAVMGFSKGGQVALLASDWTFFPEEKERFAAAIAFYPACNTRPRVPRPASVMFMALGERDDYTGVKPCQDIADDFAKAGGKISVKVYPNASHAFDGSPDMIRMVYIPSIETYKDCVLDVDPDGQMSFAGGKRYPPGDPEATLEAKRTCMKKGVHIWTNVSQKEQATRDALSFLAATFPP